MIPNIPAPISTLFDFMVVVIDAYHLEMNKISRIDFPKFPRGFYTNIPEVNNGSHLQIDNDGYKNVIGYIALFFAICTLFFFFLKKLMQLIEDRDEVIIENKYEKLLNDVGYDGPIPAEFTDPITLSVMSDPVILVTVDHSTSRSFDKKSIDQVQEIQEEMICPLTRRRYHGYILNRDLQSAIENWVTSVVNEKNKANEALPLHALPREMAKAKLFEATQQFTLFSEKLKSGVLTPRRDEANIEYRSKTI